MNSIFVFGVRIDNLYKSEFKKNIFDIVTGKYVNPVQIATVNNEFLLEARNNKSFRDVLNSCELNLPDSIGLHLAFLRCFKFKKARYTGVEIMYDLLDFLSVEYNKVGFIVNSKGLTSLEDINKIFSKKYPNLEVCGVSVDITKKPDKHTIETIKDCKVVFCNFGAPYQDIFLNNLKNKKNLNVKVLIGVGGAFDFLSGRLSRAPKIMRILGFEWLYRLYKQPKKRFMRIFRATFVFVFLLIFDFNVCKFKKSKESLKFK